MQRTISPLAVLGLAALVAVGARCVQSSESDSTSQAVATHEAPSDVPLVLPTNFPTPESEDLLPWYKVTFDVAHNAEEAAGIARERLRANLPFTVSETDSLVYVQATVGAVRAIWDPQRETKAWETPDDVPAVIFVATGNFQTSSLAAQATGAPDATFTRVWVVVPLGQRGTKMLAGNLDYDLSQLGEVHEVPLAPFPTPVSLGTPEAGAE